MKHIAFSPPRMDEAIIEEVSKVLRSGWITTGPVTKALEQEVAALSGVPKAFCVNSATAGLELMLRWLGVQEGDEVIVPAYTYCATANVVVHCGATPVMVDICEDTLTIDPKKVAAAIGPKTKAIIPVDLGGLPADYQELWDVVQDAKVVAQFQAESEVQKKLGRIMILADAAHSIGAEYKGRSAASWADAAVFSFHAVKNLTTAEGGAICLNLPPIFDQEAIYKLLNTWSLHGQNKDALAKLSGGNNWEYDVEMAGYKCNLPDVLAAIGLVEIKRYREEVLPQRKKIVEAYIMALENYDRAILPIFKTVDKTSAYHLFPLRIKDISLEQRNEIIKMVHALRVSVNVHYKPLPLLTVYKNRGYRMEDYPVAQKVWEHEISLPVYFDLGEAEVRKVMNALVQATERVTMPLIIPRDATI